MRRLAFLLVLCLAAGCSGTRPQTLGVHAGRLAPCPSTPNCVSSQAPPSDAEHYVEPLRFDGPVDAAIARLVGVLEDMSRMEVITRTADYLHVEATSLIFRFVDDVEFLFVPEEGLIHCRSASRLGRSDLGVNRDRIEEIRERLREGAQVRD